MTRLSLGVLSMLLVFGTALSAGRATAQEAIVTLRSTVSGNQEQPKVMYIVPWQQPGNSEFEYTMESNIADELFAPVDRDEFVRELGYKAMLNEPQQHNNNAE
jgi:hypothetical protein